MNKLEQIKSKYNELLESNKINNEEQLKQYYETFASNFSPDKLKNIDGEILLETMFNHGNKGSLVYWLEFKNDNELPAVFGGIGGGSSFKFGIYKRKEDGKWITGSPRDPKITPINEAVKIAREKRDLIIKGAEIISSLPDKYDDDTYKKLQADLETHLGSLADTAWVHKYYHMMFPNRVDDFHKLEFQQLYLIKLFEKPIQTNGRYVLTGHYIRMARELGIPVTNLTFTLSEIYGSYHSYWRIGTTDDTGKSILKEMFNNGCVSIGWPKLNDLSSLDLSNDKKAKEQIKTLLNKEYSNDPRAIGKTASQIHNFIKYVVSNDIVVAANEQTVMAIGRVTGEYEFKKDLEFPHTIKVDWLMEVDKEQLPNPSEGLRTTVTKYKNLDNIYDIEKLIKNGGNKVIGNDAKKFKPLEKLTGITAQIEGILQRKNQVILYGPPGTGKTYWAERACFELAARKAFNKSYGELTDQEQITIEGNEEQGGLVRMCCFHSSYGYEDFIEGIKPEASEDEKQTIFKLKSGIFKSICKDGEDHSDKNYYLIIDEINRGDISRIFGELITIVESGKRGKKMILPLSGKSFSVPVNVFIVGTMNTADRSIALLDVALRRRFGFIELMPDYSLLSGINIEGLPVGLWLQELNKRICQFVGRDARNLQVGHSYFMEKGGTIKSFESFRRIVLEDILPLIEEYCYGDYNTISKIIGDGIIDVENQSINYEIFRPSKKEELINALLSPCPEIRTSVIIVDEDDLEPISEDEVENTGV